MTTGNSSFSSERLAESLAQLPVPAGYVVAFSGGGDSKAVLLALHELEPRLPLRAVHVSHGLHENAPRWADRCRALCDRIGLPLEVIDVRVSDDGRGLEAAARRARYHAFESSLRPGEMLLTGHHRDDQAETLLLQLVRGAGLDGLSGMAACRPLGEGWLARPLLDVSRVELRAWLESRGEDWVEDPDNDNLERGRNFIRHRVMPLIESRWPGAAAVLARDADNLSDARTALESWCRESLAEALTPAGDGLRLDVLAGLGQARARQVLRLWLRHAGLPTPQRDQFDELMSQAFGAGPNAMPLVTWPGAEVRRYRDVLYAMVPRDEPDPSTSLEWDVSGPLELPAGIGRLVIAGPPGGNPGWRLRVGFRRGGERIRLPGRQHDTELKTLMQDMGVPPWERGRVPLVYDDGELAAVGDWRFSNSFAKRLKAAESRLLWETI